MSKTIATISLDGNIETEDMREIVCCDLHLLLIVYVIEAYYIDPDKKYRFFHFFVRLVENKILLCPRRFLRCFSLRNILRI